MTNLEKILGLACLLIVGSLGYTYWANHTGNVAGAACAKDADCGQRLRCMAVHHGPSGAPSWECQPRSAGGIGDTCRGDSDCAGALRCTGTCTKPRQEKAWRVK